LPELFSDDALYSRERCYEKLGELKKALADYDDAIKLAPKRAQYGAAPACTTGDTRARAAGLFREEAAQTSQVQFLAACCKCFSHQALPFNQLRKRQD